MLIEPVEDSLAIVRNGTDYMRIKPWGKSENETEIKFSFLDPSIAVRRFAKNYKDGGLLYEPIDYGYADNEITYHNSNEWHPTASLLPKYRDAKKPRLEISDKVVSLRLAELVVPIPLCRITLNNESIKKYSEKKKHYKIDLSGNYNTCDIYVCKTNYDWKMMCERFPIIVGQLFTTTTLDYFLYGAGFGIEPIFQKMAENNEPVIGIEFVMIGKIQVIIKKYKLPTTDNFKMYWQAEYSQENIVEFFDNIEFLDLLAITKVSFKDKFGNRQPTKLAYEHDMEYLKRIGFHKDYIKRFSRRFKARAVHYKDYNKFRTGVIL